MGQPLAAPQQTASVAPSNPSPAPAASAPTESRAPVASFSNWTSQGGTPIVMAQGESVKVLSDRYGARRIAAALGQDARPRQDVDVVV